MPKPKKDRFVQQPPSVSTKHCTRCEGLQQQEAAERMKVSRAAGTP